MKARMDSKDEEILELKEQLNKVLQVAESNYKSYDNLVEEVYQKAKGRLGEKDQEINELKTEMKKISETFKSYEDHVARWGERMGARPLTSGQLERVEYFRRKKKVERRSG